MKRLRPVVWIIVAALVAVGGALSLIRSGGADRPPAYLTDTYGRALIANGFNTANSAKTTPDGLPEFTEADLDRERADMGTNFVRFLISWRAVEPAPGRYDTGYLDKVAERVGWYADRGYHVMLDMHQDLWGVGITSDGEQVGNGAPDWATYLDGHGVGHHDMWELYYFDAGVIRAFDNFWNTTGRHPELMEHYAGAWRAVAERFAGTPAVVAYDLMNEPYGGTMQGPRFEAGPLSELYQRTTAAIREVDDDTWVCLEPQAAGYNWGVPTGLRKIVDPRAGGPRIAFCPHLYPLPLDLGNGYTGRTKDLVDWAMRGWRQNTERTAARLGDVPVILAEFGLDTTLPGALDYVAAVHAMTDAMGAGSVYWSRDPGSWGPYEEDGQPRNLVAAIDRAYPRAVAGTPISWSAGDRTVALWMEPDPAIAAPTEFYLPAASFPNGADVDGADFVSWDPETRVFSVRVTPDRKRSKVVLTAR